MEEMGYMFDGKQICCHHIECRTFLRVFDIQTLQFFFKPWFSNTSYGQSSKRVPFVELGSQTSSPKIYLPKYPTLPFGNFAF